MSHFEDRMSGAASPTTHGGSVVDSGGVASGGVDSGGVDSGAGGPADVSDSSSRSKPPSSGDLPGRSTLEQFTPSFVQTIWARLSNSFWFFPAISIAAAVAAAIVAVGLDDHFTLSDWPLMHWTAITPQAGTAVLSTVVGALVTVTGVAFSVMMLVLSQTAAQVGPRVVRTVVSGNQLQLTLAVLIAISAFNLIVLQSIREPGQPTESAPDPSGFVPETAVAIGIAAFFVAIGMLVYFVNHVSRIIRVPDLLARLAADLNASIERNRPPGARPAPLVDVPDGPAGVVTSVFPGSDGYLQSVDLRDLVEVADEADAVVRILLPVGSFVRQDRAVAEVRGTAGIGESAREKLSDAFVVGASRTPQQDIGSPVREIAEIAVRALSPGINDPRTACMCVDRLTAGLCRVASRPVPPTEFYDGDGHLRVRRPAETLGDLLAGGFSQIVFYSGGDATVLRRVIGGLRQVAATGRMEADRRAVAAFARQMRAQIDPDIDGRPEAAELIGDFERLASGEPTTAERS